MLPLLSFKPMSKYRSTNVPNNLYHPSDHKLSKVTQAYAVPAFVILKHIEYLIDLNMQKTI
jgi:hypothetical protein